MTQVDLSIPKLATLRLCFIHCIRDGITWVLTWCITSLRVRPIITRRCAVVQNRVHIAHPSICANIYPANPHIKCNARGRFCPKKGGSISFLATLACFPTDPKRIWRIWWMRPNQLIVVSAATFVFAHPCYTHVGTAGQCPYDIWINTSYIAIRFGNQWFCSLLGSKRRNHTILDVDLQYLSKPLAKTGQVAHTTSCISTVVQ